MNIQRISIKNYRLLKDFSIDLEKELSLVVGKNNTGKTSLLTALSKFLNGSDQTRFSFDDFNIDLKREIQTLVEDQNLIHPDGYKLIGIELELLIGYNEVDDLSNISRVMMDLDPDHKFILLHFGYLMDHSDLIKLRSDYSDFKIKESEKLVENPQYQEKDLFGFLSLMHTDYFHSSRRSLSCDKESGVSNNLDFIDLDGSEKISLKNIINFKFISAKRDVTNKEINKTLSIQTSKIYEKTDASDEQKEEIAKFKDKLSETDATLTKIYDTLFEDTIEKVREFGGLRKGDSEISIQSTLQHRDLLSGNTTVMYRHGEHSFPEYNNGLGYMNLISIIFEIEIKVQEFKRSIEETPADINLLFIEEPEAHTHPQMQYVFIKNIKKLLKEGISRPDGNWEMQYIISTHSPHIVAECDFNDLRYLKKVSDSSVEALALKELEKEYIEDGEEKNFRFLKQYLTLNKSELFFADKAILIEGDTERILVPAMMKKIDQESTVTGTPLLSQNISVVEVGAYSHVFEKFIDFIGLTKCLIITDIDSYYKRTLYGDDGVTPLLYGNGEEKKETIQCSSDDINCTNTSNASLIYFHRGNNQIEYFNNLTLDWKILRKNRAKKWVSNRKGYVLLCYQTLENGYGARSFEDSFVNLNKDFISNGDNDFKSITPKYMKKYIDDDIHVLEFTDKGISRKPSFAIEVLLNSVADGEILYSNWQTPAYIREGLIWLKKDE